MHCYQLQRELSAIKISYVNQTIIHWFNLTMMCTITIYTVHMHYNQLHIVEYRYRLSVSAVICYIISVIGISAKCCIGAPLDTMQHLLIVVSPKLCEFDH